MIRRVLLASIFLLTSIFSSAQMNGVKEQSFGDRLSFGGNFGLGFGSITYINLSPRIGYKFTDKFTGGLGYIYQYVSYEKDVYGFPFQSTTNGGAIFGRYRFLDTFFATAEYQNLNMGSYDENLNLKGRIDVPIFFVGGGYLQPIGGRSYLSMSAMIDIIDSRYSPYQNPVIQVGFIANP